MRGLQPHARLLRLPEDEVMTDMEKAMDAALADAERAHAIAADLVAKSPGLHPLTALIIAGDIQSADRASAEVAAGMDATEAYVMVGSFARWDWVVTMVKAGAIPMAWFVENIADLWRSSDPDDTNPEYLAIWQRVYASTGGVIRDGRPLPKGKDGLLRIYRGGSASTVAHGFAWTTDPKVARKFAVTHGQRQPMAGGVVITGLVRPSSVLAYLTERSESEVIVDPRLVTDVHRIGTGA
jgi:hypothetical protein